LPENIVARQGVEPVHAWKARPSTKFGHRTHPENAESIRAMDSVCHYLNNTVTFLHLVGGPVPELKAKVIKKIGAGDFLIAGELSVI